MDYKSYLKRQSLKVTTFKLYNPIICVFIFLIVLIDSHILCSANLSLPLEEMSQFICKDVGVVGQVYKTKNKAPVAILEEIHNSIEGQLEHAIMLNRMYSKYGMKNIALEGYLREGEQFDMRWFSNAAANNFDSRLRVAVQLLQEGEISGAEFMKLAYDDVVLHPIERPNEYNKSLPEKLIISPKQVLIKIVKVKIPNLGQTEVSEELKQAVSSFKEAEKTGDKYLMESHRKVITEEVNLFYTNALKNDPWALAKYKLVANPNWHKTVTLKEYVKNIKEIKMKAKEVGVELSQSERDAYNAYINFYDARDRASKTMVLYTKAIANNKSISLVPMIIGGAHTRDVEEEFRLANHPFFTLTPLSYLKLKTNYSGVALKRKYEGESLYPKGFMKILAESVNSSTEKNQCLLYPLHGLKQKQNYTFLRIGLST